MKKLVIVGAGGHGRVVADIAIALNKYNEIVFLDDNGGNTAGPYEIYGKVNDFHKLVGESDFLVAIGSNNVRKKVTDLLVEGGANMTSLVHPSAVLGSGVKIGKGVAVMAGAVINNGAVIGDGVIINTCASVDHDCVIGDFTHVSVGAHVAGTVSVGKNCFICAGATVINNINICDSCIVGAGAVVVSDIDLPGTYLGVPAVLKKTL